MIKSTLLSHFHDSKTPPLYAYSRAQAAVILQTNVQFLRKFEGTDRAPVSVRVGAKKVIYTRQSLIDFLNPKGKQDHATR